MIGRRPAADTPALCFIEEARAQRFLPPVRAFPPFRAAEDRRADVRVVDRPFAVAFCAVLRAAGFALPRDRAALTTRRAATVARRRTFFTALDAARRGLSVRSTAEAAASAAAAAAELAAPVADCAASTTVRVAVPIVLPTASAAWVTRLSSLSSSRYESSAIASPCSVMSASPRGSAAHVSRRSSKRCSQCRVKMGERRVFVSPAGARQTGGPWPGSDARHVATAAARRPPGPLQI
jgi:hypothetical protein